MLTNKTILITEGTGYLGQALTEEILKQNPKSIRVFSRDEVKHFKFQRKLSRSKKKIRNFLGDIRDYQRLLKATRGVDTVIHAAALKMAISSVGKLVRIFKKGFISRTIFDNI
jgi:UDP-N-acetylglucosamine 4,6-dehydratase